MKKIIINSKKHGVHEVLLDDEDYDSISKYKWYVIKNKNTFYAQRNEKKTVIKMHRQILKIRNSYLVDHKDHNGLNNQKYNLRECTTKQNNMNKLPYGKINISGVDIRNNKNGNSYRVRIVVNGKRIYLGTYKTLDVALNIRNENAIKYHGEFAYIG